MKKKKKKRLWTLFRGSKHISGIFRRNISTLSSSFNQKLYFEIVFKEILYTGGADEEDPFHFDVIYM